MDKTKAGRADCGNKYWFRAIVSIPQSHTDFKSFWTIISLQLSRFFSHLDQVTLRANAYLNNEFDGLTFGVFFISLCSQPLPIIKWSIVLKFSLGLFWQNIQWNTQNESFSSRQSSHSGWIYSLLKNRFVCIMWLIFNKNRFEFLPIFSRWHFRRIQPTLVPLSCIMLLRFKASNLQQTNLNLPYPFSSPRKFSLFQRIDRLALDFIPFEVQFLWTVNYSQCLIVWIVSGRVAQIHSQWIIFMYTLFSKFSNYGKYFDSLWISSRLELHTQNRRRLTLFDRWLTEGGQLLVVLKLVDQWLGLLPIENRGSYARLSNPIAVSYICSFQIHIYCCVSIHRFHRLKNLKWAL